MSFASPPSGQTVLTRRVAPSHQPWVPEPYMERGVTHLMDHRAGGLALDPGMRKTSITLAAFSLLKKAGKVRTMLVVAPLRVCRQVWRQEGAKWSQFRHLRFSLLHGDKKALRLKDDADIWLINPEGVPWLAKQYFGRPLPFDVVTIDELTKFKNHQSERAKALRPRMSRTPYRWGLTGSLAPNGYMDLFGQMLMLDDGAALGRYITHYRDSYFQVDYDGFSYNLLPGAERRIVAKIAPYWLQLSADDYIKLPKLMVNPIMLDFDKASQRIYDTMKRDMIAALPQGVVTAANTAATYSKLAQMANGSVYIGDSRQVAHVHDLKLDAIEELVEELNGRPLLIAYEFNHDLDRLRERFGVLDKATGQKVLPYLGKGTTEKQENAWIAAWNRGELPIMAAHPASAGHGLNLQEGHAQHVAWFGITWDLELYDQFIRRLRRSGNEAAIITNHLLMVRGTIDELKLDALKDKDMTQGRLLKALNSEILRDAEAHAGGVAPVQDDRRLPMVAKLSRQGGGQEQQQQPQGGGAAQEQPRATPKGWGAGGAAQQHDNGGQQAGGGQRERIAETIAPQGEQQPRGGAFTGNVREQMEQLAGTDYDAPPAGGAQPQNDPAPPATRTRAPRGAGKTAEVAQDNGADLAAQSHQALMHHRVECLKIAFSDPSTSLEDGLEIARDLAEFVVRG